MKALITICILLQFGFSISQNETNKTFPKDYIGIYKGDLTINNANGTQIVPMEFHLKSTDSINVYNYSLVYIINGKASPRDYKLIVIDEDKGLYKIDENNGIELNATYSNNTLTSIFKVQGNLLVTTERFFNDAMDFEIVFSKKEQQIKTTATKENIDVISYPITTTQTAKLIKQ